MPGSDLCSAHLGRSGRPTVLDERVQDVVVQALSAGNVPEVAARYAGVSRVSFYAWLRRAESGEQPYADFAVAVEGARAAGEVRNVTQIAKAAAKDWKAAAWLLERTAPERWLRVASRPLAQGGSSDDDDTAAPSDPLAEVDELAARRLAARDERAASGE